MLENEIDLFEQFDSIRIYLIFIYYLNDRKNMFLIGAQHELLHKKLLTIL